jgi:hypothetical protein
MGDLTTSRNLLRGFMGDSLKNTVCGLERAFVGKDKDDATRTLVAEGVSNNLFEAALLVKQTASQIDELVHTLGILLCLPRILREGEVVESLSLAAGNTGKGFDLETTHRIAEFTFIGWKGGPEVIRQNKVFKDFYFLAEEETAKRRELYVVGSELPFKFFNSKRAVRNILNGNSKLGLSFRKRYGEGHEFTVVRSYYQAKKHLVEILDISAFLPFPPLLNADKTYPMNATNGGLLITYTHNDEPFVIRLCKDCGKAMGPFPNQEEAMAYPTCVKCREAFLRYFQANMRIVTGPEDVEPPSAD